MPKRTEPVNRVFPEGLRFEDAVELIEGSEIYRIRFYGRKNTKVSAAKEKPGRKSFVQRSARRLKAYREKEK